MILGIIHSALWSTNLILSIKIFSKNTLIMTLSILALSIKTLGIIKLSIKTLSIIKLSLMKFSLLAPSMAINYYGSCLLYTSDAADE